MSFRTLVAPLALSTLSVFAVVTVPTGVARAAEAATPHDHAHRTASLVPRSKASCLRPLVEISDGRADERMALTTCGGEPAPLAVERLSVLARPHNAPKPTKSIAALSKVKGPALSPGVRRLNVGLVERLEQVTAHFGKHHHTSKVFVVSGYRPMSHGSEHQLGRALDFRIEGVSNDEIVAFCKTLTDTGCGFYPNSSFVHMDVREAGSGHVAWIDASGPGQHPRYVTAWPEPAGSEGLAHAPQGADSHDEQPETAAAPGLPSLPEPSPRAVEADKAPFAPGTVMPRGSRSFI